MHTYRKVGIKPEYQVGVYTIIGEEGVGVSDEFQILRRFKSEIQAVAFTNYLNGGTHDITLIKELLDQTDEDSGSHVSQDDEAAAYAEINGRV